jgi:protein-S-isoprenylcysteine O-methyltransferase Ste14
VSRPAVASSSSSVRWLARWRVPLGFLFALVVFWLARPTPLSLAVGVSIALAGEAIRVWAAGHLEKSREVTASGPYRWTHHPLYVGSSVIGGGLALAAAHPVAALLIAVYIGATITSAVLTEEAYLRDRFGRAYSEYLDGSAPRAHRRFSVPRVMRNREYRAVCGLLVGVGLLAVKAWVWR